MIEPHPPSWTVQPSLAILECLHILAPALATVDQFKMAPPKRVNKIRPATAVPFTLGVFTGTMLTAFLVLSLRSIEPEILVNHELGTKSPQVATPPQIKISRPKMTSRNLPTLKTISYNIVTSSDNLQTRVLPIHRTWGGGVEDIQYYLHQPGGETEINFAAKKRIPLVSLESSELSSGQGVFRMWMDICERKSSQYNWFMKLKDDAYVNTEALERLLASMNSSEPLLIGRSVYPTEEDGEEVGLSDGESYCSESGYVVSWGAMQMLCPVLPWCWENTRSENEDVEMARCLRMSGNVNCTVASEASDNITY